MTMERALKEHTCMRSKNGIDEENTKQIICECIKCYVIACLFLVASFKCSHHDRLRYRIGDGARIRAMSFSC